MASGGAFSKIDNDHCSMDGEVMTCEQFNDLMLATCENFGLGLAVIYLREETGYWCPEMDKGTGGVSDMEQMRVIMSRFWKNYK